MFSHFYLSEEILLGLFSADKKLADRKSWPLSTTSVACCKNLQLAETIDVTDPCIGHKKRKMRNGSGVA